MIVDYSIVAGICTSEISFSDVKSPTIYIRNIAIIIFCVVPSILLAYEHMKGTAVFMEGIA